MNVQVKYTGSALPGNAEVVTLFTTADGQNGGRFFANAGIKRFTLALRNDQSGTLAAQSSEDGVTWVTVASDAIVASVANTDTVLDYLVEPYTHWRLVWTNGAAQQTAWRPAMSMSSQRSPLV